MTHTTLPTSVLLTSTTDEIISYFRRSEAATVASSVGEVAVSVRAVPAHVDARAGDVCFAGDDLAFASFDDIYCALRGLPRPEVTKVTR